MLNNMTQHKQECGSCLSDAALNHGNPAMVGRTLAGLGPGPALFMVRLYQERKPGQTTFIVGPKLPPSRTYPRVPQLPDLLRPRCAPS